MITFQNLPDELLLAITEFLSPIEIGYLSLTNKAHYAFFPTPTKLKSLFNQSLQEFIKLQANYLKQRACAGNSELLVLEKRNAYIAKYDKDQFLITLNLDSKLPFDIKTAITTKKTRAKNSNSEELVFSLHEHQFVVILSLGHPMMTAIEKFNKSRTLACECKQELKDIRLIFPENIPAPIRATIHYAAKKAIKHLKSPPESWLSSCIIT